jgi:hypothetical protein
MPVFRLSKDPNTFQIQVYSVTARPTCSVILHFEYHLEKHFLYNTLSHIVKYCDVLELRH